MVDRISAVNEQRKSRIRVRRACPIESVIVTCMTRADETGHARSVEHGGSVNNSYGYPAKTQAIGVSVVRVGEHAYRVLARYAEIPANKVTKSGAAAATIGGRAVWDNRYNQTATRLARLDIIADTLRHGVRVTR